MTHGDGPEAVLRVLAQYGEDDVAIYVQSDRHINRIRSRAADMTELWEALKGYSVAALYENGRKVSAIAEALGVSTAQVHRLAQKYGATPRNKTSGEREVVPFEQTPGINALAKIRAERDRVVAELIKMHREDEAERILAVDKTLERWRWRRRKSVLGQVASGGALIAGGAAISSISTTGATTVAQLVGAGALGAALMAAPPVASSIMRDPPPAVTVISSPSWSPRPRITSTPAPLPVRQRNVLPSPSSSPSPSPSPSPVPFPTPVRVVVVSTPRRTPTPTPMSTYDNAQRDRPKPIPVLTVSPAPGAIPDKGQVDQSPTSEGAGPFPIPSPTSGVPSQGPSADMGAPADMRGGQDQ